ncbi:ATP-grasp domain-containing protein [Lysobacter sp. 22409]|uniref:ATP-grasp domain-containing protein n=1 Tax=Lysobacter sp. 22409 TaxID=3453917 RepID=UPI003F8741A2
MPVSHTASDDANIHPGAAIGAAHAASPNGFQLAVVTSTVYAEFHPDDAGLVDALRGHGIEPVACVWNDPAVDWTRFDAVLVRTTWDYFRHYDDFLAWYDQIETLGLPIANELPLLRWNSNKRYLLDLAARDVAIIPTVLARGDALADAVAAMSGREVVIKPTVSGGAWHTVRGRVGEAAFAEALAALPPELDYLVQPFMAEIVAEGEWSLMFFDGHYSHAVLKKPDAGDYRVQTDFGGSASLTEPDPVILAAARRALDAVAALGYRDQAYVRVDGVMTADGFRLMELEFIEPFLHFAAYPPAAELFAAQLARRWPSVGESATLAAG